nr:cupin domain-containing protein [Niveibacterium umoris]
MLIHVPPGAYAFEQHVADEWIVCVSGRLVMETADGGRATANAGDLLHVPAGLAHRFAQDADAVVLTLSQAAEAPPWNRA